MFLRFPVRKIVAGLVFLNLCVFFSLYLLSRWNAPPEFILNHPYFLYDLDAQEPRNPEQKCILPRLHPFDPSIWRFMKYPKGISCKKRQPDFTLVNDGGKLIFNETELNLSGYVVDKSLFCSWCQVLRSPPDNDDQVDYGKEIKVHKEGYQLTADVNFIRVRCRNFAGVVVYEKLHANVQVPEPYPTATPLYPINILIFGLDSMSRQAFIRLLPRTYRYLTQSLNMTVMRGMNKVGDNTFPNLIPILTGHKAYGDGLGSASEYFDHWPLIWKNFSDAGYGTMWAEDYIEFGLFNYLAKGFHYPPTDHYMRPYWLAIEESRLLRYSSHMCYGSLPKYFVQLDYLHKFIVAHKEAKRPYFAFSFLAELTHDYVTRISSADSHLQAFFQGLFDDGHLENTVFIVMSDHGHRFDSIRGTQVGHLEERLPFHAIYIPDSLSSLQPSVLESLYINSGRLVTPFDVHATLNDILHFTRFGRPLGKTDSDRLGQTLFKEVPLERTCSDASIPEQYCTCETDTVIPVSDPRAQRAAEVTINSINQLLVEGGRSEVCAILKLKTVRSAHLVHSAEEDDENDFSLRIGLRIRVVLEADPGGVFEALVSIQNNLAEVVGDISRISKYRYQSDCIQHVILRKFCYCKSHLGMEILAPDSAS